MIKNSWCRLGLVILALLFSACSNEKNKKSILPPAPVVVGSAVQKTVPVELRAIGNVEAYSTVSIKSKAGGELVRVHFTEGQNVKQGDLLFTIDPRPYDASLKQAEANLQRDMAMAKNAKDDASRYESLIQKGVVAPQLYEKVKTDSDALVATVLADQAAVENAKIQLDYCSIRSPIDGRTGSLLVKQGNTIKADDVPLVVINQIIPINVAFSVPESFLSEIKKYMAKGKLPVEAMIPTDGERSEKGLITFIDNAVDSSTGTIRLKGTFTNRERKLWPGQFVDVLLILSEEPNTIVVPSQAVQTGQQGQYVYVVKPDMTVESRPVTAGRTIDGETVIQKGLQPNEKVVTDGQLRLFPGARIEIKNNDSAVAPTNK